MRVKRRFWQLKDGPDGYRTRVRGEGIKGNMFLTRGEGTTFLGGGIRGF